MSEHKTRADTARKRQWKPPALLETPTPPPGYKYRWVRTNIRNEEDARNVTNRVREGFEPVRASELPDFDAPTVEHGRFKGVIGVGSLILTKVPVEISNQRQDYYEGIAARTAESIEQDLMRESHTSMPISVRNRSTVDFRRAKPEFDSDDGDVI